MSMQECPTQMPLTFQDVDPGRATAPEHAADLGDLAGLSPEQMKAMVERFAGAGRLFADSQVTRVFNPPAATDVVRLADKVRQQVAVSGWMTPAQARARVEQWQEQAAEQGKRHWAENGKRVVLSFFDYTGEWSRPWEEAGYEVWRFDIQRDEEVGDVNAFCVDFFSDWFSDFDGKEIYAILAACPCTDFSSCGAKHFAAKDADGRTLKSIRLVHKTLAAIEYFKPPVWAIENPVGRIEKLCGLPPWRLSFQPHHLGEDYTKKTLIWGRFNADLPVAPCEATAGSKMHARYGGSSLATKNARSATPPGFSYAFFLANNAIDHPVMALANRYEMLDYAAVEAAVQAGLSEADIGDLVDDFYYMDLDYQGANDALFEAAGVAATHSLRV